MNWVSYLHGFKEFCLLILCSFIILGLTIADIFIDIFMFIFYKKRVFSSNGSRASNIIPNYFKFDINAPIKQDSEPIKQDSEPIEQDSDVVEFDISDYIEETITDMEENRPATSALNKRK